jgi:hypothetical protein
MTRFIYDQFTKTILDKLLLPNGELTANQIVASERLEIDLYCSSFVENYEGESNLILRLLNRRINSLPCLMMIMSLIIN